MKKFFKSCALAALIIALSMGAMAWLFWPQRTVWPEFAAQPGSDPQAPQVVAQVERDFGWRTGDRIPVTLYFKQKPGTAIDINTLAIQGDFEIAGPPSIFVRELKDGTKLIKLKLDLQAMALKKAWKVNATMTYRAQGQADDKLITLPGLELYSSATWDGRPEIKDGPIEYVQDYHLLVNLAIILAGLAVVGLCIRVIRVANRDVDVTEEPVVLGPREIARRDFDKVWALIKGGDVSVENYKEIERIVRRLYRIEARTLREVDWELHNHPFRKEALTILINCDKVLYHHNFLNDAEHEAILAAFNKMVPRPSAPRAATVKPQARK